VDQKQEEQDAEMLTKKEQQKDEMTREKKKDSNEKKKRHACLRQCQKEKHKGNKCICPHTISFASPQR
jgi:hypothetical protein